MIRAALASGHPHLEGITLERLDRERSVRLNLGAPFQPFANGGFGTASGKCDLSAETLDYVPPIESRLGDAALHALYPLELVSSKNDDSMNSTFGHRAAVDADTSVVWLHPADAAARSVADGDAVLVFNGRGSLETTARVAAHTRPGVVRIPSVGWGRNANALTPERLTDIGGGPTFYNCLVEVNKCVQS